MANSRATNRKKWWEAIDLRVGVIAAIFGLATTAFSFIKTEFVTKAPVNKELLPNLKVSYISMAGNIYAMTDGDSISKRRYYLNYPILKNEIDDSSRNQDAGLSPDSTFAEQTAFTTCLMIENKGKGDADSVIVELSKISSDLPLKIDEAQTVNYDNQIRAHHPVKKELIHLPQSLLTGQGILVPLFTSYHPRRYTGNDKKWTIVSRLIFLPESMRYKDATDTTQKTIKVRKMQAPVRLEEGVEVRG